MRVISLFSLFLASAFAATQAGQQHGSQAGEVAHPKGAHSGGHKGGHQGGHHGAKQGGQKQDHAGGNHQHQQTTQPGGGKSGGKKDPTDQGHKGDHHRGKQGGKHPDHQKGDGTPEDGHGKKGNSTSPAGPKPAGAYPMPMPCSGNCTTYLDNTIIRRKSDGLLFRFLMRMGRIYILTAPHISGPWIDAPNNNTDVKPGLENTVLPNGPVKNPMGGDEFRDNDWAPDVHYFKTDGGQDKYVLLYSDWNSPDKFDPHWNGTLSYAVSDTMDPGTWKDMGSLHLPQPENGDYTLIGPNLLLESNPPSLSFSSDASGFYHVNMTLDPFAVEEGSVPQKLIADEQVPGAGKRNESEGSFQFQWGKWTYMFFSRGLCCTTPDVPYPSVYRVEVCRAPSAQGPYSNKDGHSCLHPENGGRGTVVLESHGNVHGPGSVGVMNDTEEGLIMFYEYSNTSIGLAIEQKQFGWNYLDFDKDDWPVLVAQRNSTKTPAETPFNPKGGIKGSGEKSGHDQAYPKPQSPHKQDKPKGKKTPKDKGGPKDKENPKDKSDPKGHKDHKHHGDKGGKEGDHHTTTQAQVSPQKEQKEPTGSQGDQHGQKPSGKKPEAHHDGKGKHHHGDKKDPHNGHKGHGSPKPKEASPPQEKAVQQDSGANPDPSNPDNQDPKHKSDGQPHHNGQNPDRHHHHGKKQGEDGEEGSGKHDGKGGKDGPGNHKHGQHPKPQAYAGPGGWNSTLPHCKHPKAHPERPCRNETNHPHHHHNGTRPHRAHRNKTTPEPVPIPTSTAPAPLYSTGAASPCFAPGSQVQQYTFIGGIALLFSFTRL